MTDDVKELKEFFLYRSVSNDTKVTPTILNEGNEKRNVNVNWEHKFQIGDTVKYKHNGKSLCIAEILDKEYEYKCRDAKGSLLTAVFLEDELY